MGVKNARVQDQVSLINTDQNKTEYVHWTIFGEPRHAGICHIGRHI